jgi:hypothetical protein
LRDDRLWTREVQRARLLNLKQIHCPCSKCRGRQRLRLTIVQEHLIQNGRDSEFRVWRGPSDRDSSDEEWEQEFWRPEQQPAEALDEQIDTRNMINNTLQECDDPIPLEERLQEVVAEAFTVGDNIHTNVGPLTTGMKRAFLI